MKITWDQVFAWRLRRQFVALRRDVSAGEVASRLCGIQAQVASAAEMAVGIRQAKPKTDGVRRGLSRHLLIKTWGMRGTLHVFHSSEVGAYLSLMASARTWEKPSWQRAFGASPKEIAELAEAVSSILDGSVLTRDELVAEIVVDKRFRGMAEQLRSGWGTLLKPLAWQGTLCHGPSDAGKIMFTRPANLISDWKGLPAPDEAAPVAITAYLGAYGPATPEVFDAWLSRNSLRKTTLRKWFADLGDKLTEVDVEGQKAVILAEHADELAAAEPNRDVRLLGAFDQYVLGPGTKDAQLLPQEHRAKVSRSAGWISPIVVVGGRIVGVWELSGAELVVSLFQGVKKPSLKDVAAEAAQVAQAAGINAPKVRFG
ncbi:winged helix DNA-binding domain-containing protein [Saccharopolyspora sp. K220]|uniref:DNA glycosylase AlkZ-like family protein n=1 Tax=Saccharopolyspora soli TaxID=2926618 RepID=UPI001F5748FF|nr:crosslink repair DNA glycosylase YcaQ family protein [Saccharopolyspora soli]MCI2419488.1 winged helix DNA-binding domain-containing protein [Saccharopolyspora soli]